MTPAIQEELKAIKEELRQIREILDSDESPQDLADIEQARKEYREGETVSHEQMMQELKRR